MFFAKTLKGNESSCQRRVQKYAFAGSEKQSGFPDDSGIAVKFVKPTVIRIYDNIMNEKNKCKLQNVISTSIAIDRPKKLKAKHKRKLSQLLEIEDKELSDKEIGDDESMTSKFDLQKQNRIEQM